MQQLQVFVLALALGQCPGGVCPIQPQQPRWQPAPRVQEQRQPGTAGPYAAHPWHQGTVDDCVCQVQSDKAYGSGTCVYFDAGRGQGFILTAAHVVEGGSWFRMTFPTGTICTGSVAGSDRDADIAFLLVTSDKPLKSTSIGADDTQPGERILKIGFPSAQHVLGEGTPWQAQGSQMWGKLHVRPGDSGCGVFDDRGFLVGVVSAFLVQQPEVATYARVGPIRRLFDRCRDQWWERRQQQPQPQPIPAPRASGPAPLLPSKPPGNVPPPASAQPNPQPPLPRVEGPPAPTQTDKQFADVLENLKNVHGKLDALTATYQQHKGSLDKLNSAVNAVRSGQQQPNPVLDRVASDLATVRSAADTVVGTAGTISDKLKKVEPILETVNGLAAQVGGNDAALGGLTAFAKWLPLIAGGSLAGPAVPLLLAGGGLLLRLAKRKSGTASGQTSIPDAATLAASLAQHLAPLLPPRGGLSTTSPVVEETPPPPQKVVTQTQYVPYSQDKSDEARAWAKAQIARKYPGMIDAAEKFDSLVAQFLNSQSQQKG